ncbi:MAG: hypothetical protein C5B50_27995, partial [Verrucomicrobia bacterium]
MEKWIFENWLSPGDVVMLTAAVRDLHRAYPGRFLTDVRTSCPALWRHNPHLTPLKPKGRGVRSMLCHYPLIHQSNTAPYHFIHGFIEYFNAKLGLNIRPTEFKGDIHLGRREKSNPGPVEEMLGNGALSLAERFRLKERSGLRGEEHGPYWIISAGGKYDFTVKWWHRRRWQEVVDHFHGRLLFVQVGDKGHYHPPLKGVLDLRGKTSLR